MNTDSAEIKPSGILGIAIDRPVTMVVIGLLICLAGSLSLALLPIQLTPSVVKPVISVTTAWPGAAPTEIEAEILAPQEEAVKGVQGLQRMTAEASLGVGTLTLEFSATSEIDRALVRVSNALTQVDDYPSNVREPSLRTADASGPLLAVIALRHRKGQPVEAYYTYLEQRILPRLQRVPGVGDVRLRGGREQIIRIDFDPRALGARKITIARLAQKIRDELRDFSAGDVTVGRRRVLVRTMGITPKADQLEQIVVGNTSAGGPIYLRDVAKASIALSKQESFVLTDDKPSLVFLLQAEAGSNILDVTKRIRSEVDYLDREVFSKEDLHFSVISDQLFYINDAFRLVSQNLIIGALLAIGMLFFFLRSTGASLIISVAIPICVFGTLFGLTLLGRTINVVSLAGITFAVGMVLDNAIVALESIDSWRYRVSDSKLAAFIGVRKVWGALIASTATTAAAFLPLLGWQSEVGQVLRDVAIAISFAIGTSFLVSVWIIPSLASRLPSRSPGVQERHNRWLVHLRSGVGRLAESMSRSRRRALTVVLGALLLAGTSVYLLMPPLDYLPAGNRNIAFGILLPPPGTSVAELRRVGEKLQERMVTRTAPDSKLQPALRRSFFVGLTEQVFCGIVAEDPSQIKALKDWVSSYHRSIPGFMGFTVQPSIFGRIEGGRAVTIDFLGRDLKQLTRIARQAFAAIRQAVPGAQVRPLPSLDDGALELRAYPRRNQVARLSMGTAELGQAIDAMVDGAIIGEAGLEGEPQLDVVLRAQRQSGETIDDAEALRSSPIVTPSGHVVPLGTLTDIKRELGPTKIRRSERQRAITLQVAPPDEIAVESAVERIETEVLGKMRQSGALPGDVETSITGTAGDLFQAIADYKFILLLALLISYLLMSALFEDFLAPLVILITVPLATMGGLLALRLVDAVYVRQPLDLLTAVGFLILLGVIVNNAILVVDGAIDRLREGDNLVDAISAASQSRVRPILMTTGTSLAGLLPMVISQGSGAELYRGVATVVLGGLAFGTVLTLVVVPALFSLVWQLRNRGQA